MMVTKWILWTKRNVFEKKQNINSRKNHSFSGPLWRHASKMATIIALSTEISRNRFRIWQHVYQEGLQRLTECNWNEWSTEIYSSSMWLWCLAETAETDQSLMRSNEILAENR